MAEEEDEAGAQARAYSEGRAQRVGLLRHLEAAGDSLEAASKMNGKMRVSGNLDFGPRIDNIRGLLDSLLGDVSESVGPASDCR